MISLLLLYASLAQASSKPDACALLANDDVKAVLGVDVNERRPATQQTRDLLLTQCYYGTATARSVSVALAGATKSGGKTVTPRQFWQEQFHPKQKDKAESGEPQSDARPVPGVGEEAFWSGNRVAGALYVLRGRTFIRVSVGGLRDEQERIAKSKALALAALQRLP